MSVLKNFTRTLHWGPLIALGIIKMVTITTLQCAPVWLQSHSPFVYLLNMSLFIFCSSMTVFHFFASLALGPGYVPLTWSPEKKKHNAFLQFCKVCNGYKAPRSHHCSKCQRCVLKMDHHCPWINNCVGHTNHGHFTAFLAFAVVGCAHASVILGGYLYSALSKPWYPRHAAARFVSPWGLFWIVMSLGLAIGVVIAVGILLFFQVKSILKNRTGIEDWIVEKANARRSASGDAFLYPYDLGRRENWKQVVSLFCKPVGDGITWPVRDGCNQYTLTVEQLQQKSLKRIRSVDYEVTRRYSGSWFPLWHGLRTAFCQPCSDEARIGLEVGDIVTVTRWKKYWYYGELSKRNPELYDGGNRVKGWFPKNSVNVIDFDAPSESHSEKAKKSK